MKINRGWVAIAAGAAALLLACEAQAVNLKDLLRRSATVERKVSYQGRKVLVRYRNGRATSTTYKAYHKAPNRTLMVGVDGGHVGTRLVQINDEHYLRQAYTHTYRQPTLPPPRDNTALLTRNYRIKPLRVEMIARRRCQMVGFWPRHAGNPSKLVWIDLSTGLPLKTQIRAADGSLTEESYFLFIDYRPQFSRGMFTIEGDIVQEWPEVEPNFDVVRVRPEALPAGYRLVRTLNRRSPKGHVFSFQRFSNGLNTITLAQSRTHPDPGMVTGACAVEGRIGRIRYAICGEHRQDVLVRMAKGLKGKPVTIQVSGR